MPVLHKLFNKILMSGLFPDLWTKSCIVPVHKKGDIDDVNNYRGISIVSCFGKLFTSVLNNRILEWDNKYDILTDAQFGFRPGLSTVDAIFVLQSLINKTLCNKNVYIVVLWIFKRHLTLLTDASYGIKYIKLVYEGNYYKLYNHCIIM
mgnify:CR=1 FL=1